MTAYDWFVVVGGVFLAFLVPILGSLLYNMFIDRRD